MKTHFGVPFGSHFGQLYLGLDYGLHIILLSRNQIQWNLGRSVQKSFSEYSKMNFGFGFFEMQWIFFLIRKKFIQGHNQPSK